MTGTDDDPRISDERLQELLDLPGRLPPDILGLDLALRELREHRRFMATLIEQQTTLCPDCFLVFQSPDNLKLEAVRDVARQAVECIQNPARHTLADLTAIIQAAHKLGIG
jgi:hypothetical protein